MLWSLPIWLNVGIFLWTIVLGLLYRFFTSHFDHWQKKGVVFEKGLPFFGSLYPSVTLQKPLMQHLDDLYKKYGSERFVGIFQGRRPALLVRDPQLIKHITVKDFGNFHDHGFRIDEEIDPIQGKNLFNLDGERWKEMRAKLTPTFTSGKIKTMTPMMQEVATTLQEHLSAVTKGSRLIEAKEVFARYSTDVISSCVFGIECNSINNPKNKMRTMGEKIAHVDFWRAIKIFTVINLPEIADRLKFVIMDSTVTAFFRNLVKNLIEARRKTGESRKDFIQLLIDLKDRRKQSNAESVSNRLTDDDLMAQTAVFFLAGFETSALTLSTICYELSRNLEIQNRAQSEIDFILAGSNGNLSHEALKEMKLRCSSGWILEALRKYPPAGNLMRVCTENYIIPNTEVLVEKGTMLLIPSYSLQNDPKYFPNPEIFDPERFWGENSKGKSQFVHLPFGEGPRHCIGQRFAFVQIKMALAIVLSKFRLTLNELTNQPLRFDPKTLISTPLGGIWLNIEERI
ncbi:cytochrome P450 6B1-like [Cloeon dipterum]|uniref:cytochrome P450 6B1-like n=1 Tax=Cloeon dipterum TaxID=197152 RepID=UPI00321F65AC